MAGTAHPVIDVRGLGHLYDGERGLQRLDLQVGVGEAVALVGHNGSGKTTALQCIAGLLNPTSGSVRVLDADPLVELAGIHGAAHGVIDDLGRGAGHAAPRRPASNSPSARCVSSADTTKNPAIRAGITRSVRGAGRVGQDDP